MDILAPRAARTCKVGKLFYACAAGPFTGCCSVDPCTDGICPDADSTTTKKSTSSKTTTTSESTQTTLATIASTSTNSSKDQTSSASEQSSSTSIATTSTATPTQTAATGSTSSNNHRKAGLIGGVVGGLLAAIILALLLFFCIKRRKAKVKITLHRSVSTESLRRDRNTKPSPKNNPSPANTPARTAADTTVIAGIASGSTETQPLTASTSPASNPRTTIVSSPEDTNSERNPLNLPSTISSLTLSSTSNTNSSTNLNPAPRSSRNTRRLSPLMIPMIRPVTPVPQQQQQQQQQQPLTPRAAGYVPELSDTGFWRQRVELPASPRVELINQHWYKGLPPAQDHEHELNEAGPSFSSNSGMDLGSQSTGAGTARRFVTKDGIVMGANLDRMSSIDEIEIGSVSSNQNQNQTPFTPSHASASASGRHTSSNFSKSLKSGGNWSRRPGVLGKTSNNQHVMSFMEYTSSPAISENQPSPSWSWSQSQDVEMSERRPSGASGGASLTGLGLGLGENGSPEFKPGRWARKPSQSQSQNDSNLSKALDSGFGMEIDVLGEGQVGSRLSCVSEILPAYESGGFSEMGFKDEKGDSSSPGPAIKKKEDLENSS